jgi:endo-1,4-beta-xylanase
MELRRRGCVRWAGARLVLALAFAIASLAPAAFGAATADARQLTVKQTLRLAAKHERKARRCGKLQKRELRLARKKHSLKARRHRRRAKKYGACARRHRKAAARLRRRAASLSRVRAPRRAPVPLGAALSWAEVQADPRQGDTFLRDFDQMTPENELKWDSVHPGILTWQFTEADQMVDWARGNGKRVRGHTLIWSTQNPAWLEDFALSRDALLLVMKNHIRKTMQHFTGRIMEWDVVNEAIDGDGNWTDNIWYRVIGPEYVELAFRYAHEADPNALLYYNEQGLDIPDNPRALAVVSMLRGLLARGVPVNGVGMQSHVSTQFHASQAQVSQLMKNLARLGLDVAITEMDVRTDAPGTLGQQLEAQRSVYGDYARACRLERHCSSFTTWGVSDTYSWYDRPEWAPLLFNGDFNPKPAYYAVRDWVQTP